MIKLTFGTPTTSPLEISLEEIHYFEAIVHDAEESSKLTYPRITRRVFDELRRFHSLCGNAHVRNVPTVNGQDVWECPPAVFAFFAGLAESDYEEFYIHADYLGFKFYCVAFAVYMSRKWVAMMPNEILKS